AVSSQRGCPKSSQARGARFHGRAIGAAVCLCERSWFVAWEARRSLVALHPLSTCQNEGCSRDFTPLTKRQSRLKPGYQRRIWLPEAPVGEPLDCPANSKVPAAKSKTARWP